MRGGTGTQARRRRYINNGSNKAGRKRGIKERRSKKRIREEEGERGRAYSSSAVFLLLVPDLNSSQAPLQPFGLRLTVRPASSLFLLFHLPLCHSFVLPRPLRAARFASVSLSRNRDSTTLIHERTRVDRGAIGVKLDGVGQTERERTRQT